MEDNNLYREQRIQKLRQLSEEGVNPFSNQIVPQHLVADLIQKFGELEKEALEAMPEEFSLAGRVLAVRSFGKASFLQLKDRTGTLQVFIQKDSLAVAEFEIFKKSEVGDLVFVQGSLFRTKTQEFTLKAHQFKLVTKSVRPLPEKWHGLTDVETRYRQRYVDLIANPEVQQTFVKRSKIVQYLRQFFNQKDFLEVETPMMHPIPGGAAAKPFVTHHNALDMTLYLRVAPELYLKRLVVGGLERVFEINRNFRNEGISIQHNPEFTMLEFYQAYATYETLIQLTEELLSSLAVKICGQQEVVYQDETISFKPPFRRYRLLDSLVEIGGVDREVLVSRESALHFAERHQIKLKSFQEGHLTVLTEVFDKLVQPKLIQPTFITHYPAEVSPLSRRNEENPQFVDRFELFIYGREIANGFSELNDPFDQKERFLKQIEARNKGDEEAMYYDEDYIRALEYGMPPTAGQGIGIDRLVMLFTNQPSIRDVILFPQMRKES